MQRPRRQPVGRAARVRFSGDGWYRVLFRSAWEPAGTTRDVWIAEITNSIHEDQIGLWPRPEVAGERRHVICRGRRTAIEPNIVCRLR